MDDYKFIKSYDPEDGEVDFGDTNWPGNYVQLLTVYKSPSVICLDGKFTVEELEELVRFMKAQRDKVA